MTVYVSFISVYAHRDIVELNDLQQVIYKPIRITAHSETIICHLYVIHVSRNFAEISDLST